MIAEVFVDIPATAVDRPFDYSVPDRLADLIRPGMRVTVSFGRTRRLGFVSALKESTEFGKLKAIDSLIDFQPALTDELLELGSWLAGTVLCPTVAAYQAMLPAALKAKYEKRLLIRNADGLKEEFPQLVPLFVHGTDVSVRELVSLQPQLLKPLQEALNRGMIDYVRSVDDRGKIKKITIVRPGSKEMIESVLSRCGARSPRQKEALTFFLTENFPDAMPLKELIREHHLSREALYRLRDKGILAIEERETDRDPYAGKTWKRTEKLPLTREQSNALKPIISAIDSNRAETFLCHGVTGSGKTEIYLQAIDRVICSGKQSIVLVPEISLTPQMVERFKSRFGDQVAVLHSGLSRGEKYDEWRKIRENRVSVAVGARSAVFAPFRHLGLIIIDEEHESSYKQQDQPRYHARDVAVHRAHHHHCPVVLGSATPSLESYARARKGVYTLLTLKERFNHHPLPPVQIIDMREEMRQNNHTVFSRTLFEKLKEKVGKREQSVLFLNRRGFSTFVMCRSCGYVIKCPHCDISLTYHRTEQSLKCHYCGYEEKVPAACPACGSEAMRFFGTGTQKVEAELNRLIPEARVIRMDVDTTRRKGGHEKLLHAFAEHQADILLGTQMIAKGLDFPKVTLVGVLAADSLLYLPDFRSSEKTFQLLTQVSGRAGRRDLPGEVVIQSYTPEHYAITDAAHHDYARFYRREMQIRYQQGYPPFYYLALITLTDPEPAHAAETVERIAQSLKKNLSHEARIYGPVVPTIARIKDRYRYQCMIKYKREPQLRSVLQKIIRYYYETGKNSLQLSVDLNPVVLM